MGAQVGAGTDIRRIEAAAAPDRIGKPLAAVISRATRPAQAENALSGTWAGHPLLSDASIPFSPPHTTKALTSAADSAPGHER